MTVKNNHVTDDMVVHSAMHLVKKIKLKLKSQTIETVNFLENCIYNLLEIDDYSRSLYETLRGTSGFLTTGDVSIANNSTRSFIIKIYTPLSNSFIPRDLITGTFEIEI